MPSRRLRFSFGAVLFTSATLGHFGCSDDALPSRTRDGGGTGDVTTGNAGPTGSGPSGPTGSGGATNVTSGNNPTTGGPTNGTGGANVSTTGTSGTGGTTATTGTGGRGGSTGAGGSRDAGAIMDAKADVPLPVCNYPEWTRTAVYKAGDIVMYMGKAYVATNDNTSLDPTISTFYWQPYTGCRPPDAPPPAKCPVLDALLPNGETTFKAMFAAPFQGAVPLAPYSYTSLCNALMAPSLSAFIRSGNATQDKREVAAFFANAALETAYLTAVDEQGHNAQDQDYHGRGSLQITGQVIYSEVGGGLNRNIVQMPQLASTAPVVWETGIWYWMHHANPSAGATQICHNSIVQGDFGHTVRIIKGDCGSADMRATQYRKNCMLLNVDPGNTTCQ